MSEMFYLIEVLVPTVGRKKLGDPYDAVAAGSSANWLEENGLVGSADELPKAMPPVVQQVVEPVAQDTEVPVVEPVIAEEKVVDHSNLIQKAKDALAAGKKQLGPLAEQLEVSVKELKPVLTVENGFLVNAQNWVGLKKS